jgi:Txe/YoeB family toxin of Txe-Axe toxin-antitoxin module
MQKQEASYRSFTHSTFTQVKPYSQLTYLFSDLLSRRVKKERRINLFV